MAKMKIGVQLYTLRNFLKTPDEVAPVFEKVQAMGAEVVQVSGMCDIEAEKLKDISKSFDLPVCITHVSYDKLKNNLDKVIADHKIFGCNAVGIGMMPASFRQSDDQIKKFVDFLNDTQQVLCKEGMNMNYHNHAFEFKKMGDGKLIYDYLIENTDKGVGFIPDTFWMAHAKQNPVEYLNKLSGRINTLHLKDLKRLFGIDLIKPIGDGSLDFKKILSAAETAKCQNAVVELDFAKKPFDALKKSIDYIRTIY